MDREPLTQGSMYPVIAGSDEEYLDFVKDKGITQVSIFLHRIDQMRELKKGTTIYKGYGYINSVVLDLDITRKRVMLGELSFKDWIC